LNSGKYFSNLTDAEQSQNQYSIVSSGRTGLPTLANFKYKRTYYQALIFILIYPQGCRKVCDLTIATFCAPDETIDIVVSDISKLNLRINPYPSLHTLGIRGCFLISNDGIDLLTKRFVHLTSLDMGGLPNVSSQSFAYLSRLAKLKDLNLRVRTVLGIVVWHI
jgi:hypothetical protein